MLHHKQKKKVIIRILVINSTALFLFREINSFYKLKEIARKEALTCTSRFIDSTILTFSLLNSIKPIQEAFRLKTIHCGRSISPSRQPIASGNGIQLSMAFAKQGFENQGLAGLFQTPSCLAVHCLSSISGYT